MSAVSSIGAARRSWGATRLSGSLGVSGVIASLVILVLALVAVLAPWISPHDPNAIDLSNAFQGPSAENPLGTDASGRDLLSRLVWGARSSMVGPLIVVILATFFGVTIGLLSAWKGGWLDSLIGRCIDVMFAFPGVLLGILVVSLFGAGLGPAIIALTIAYVPYVAKMVRSRVLAETAKPYLMALSIQGVSGFSICFKHLLPNISPLIVAQSTLTFGYAMVDLAALSFLGLGVQAPTADWGVMVATGTQSVIQGFPQESLYASALIVLAVGAFNMLGDRLGAGNGEVH